jgi:hypothetical protein
MRDLTEAGRAVVENPAFDPTPVEQIAMKARRRRRRQWQSGVAIAAVVVLLAGAAAIAANRNGSTEVAIQPSTTSTPAKPAPTASAGHQIVSYHGVHVEVPASWPVVDGMHTIQCGGPFPPKTPTAFVGPQDKGPPGCFPRQENRPGPDGVWLFPSPRPTDATSVTSTSGQVLLQVSLQSRALVEWFWYHGIGIQVGIGADARIEKHIVDSIGFTDGTPDTVAAGVCARQPNPEVMPTPERLAKPFSLKYGDVTLKPPAPSDHAVISADKAWSEAGTKRNFERYRVILARLSQDIPARQNPDGSFTPLTQDVLAWVVYASPISVSVPGCGGWSIAGVNAITGQSVGGTYYG